MCCLGVLLTDVLLLQEVVGMLCRCVTLTENALLLQQVVGVWAQEVTCATTVAINHKYMLMAFGCSK